MRILILGGSGMLGHQLLAYFENKHDIKVTLRSDLNKYTAYGLFHKKNSYGGIDVGYLDKLKKILFDFSPDAVINCIGIIKQRDDEQSHISNLEINALFPHKLNLICKSVGARLVHMSTDCVFSGAKGKYNEDDFSDANDLYGRSKYLGEIMDENCITIRTSIIGLELMHKKSLIEWFLSQRGTIKGFQKAIYSGFTTIEMARIIELILIKYQELSGVYHIASEPISKYQLLCNLSEKLQRTDIVIKPDDTYNCNRSLDATRFNKETGYKTPDWDIMLNELADMIKSRCNERQV